MPDTPIRGATRAHQVNILLHPLSLPFQDPLKGTSAAHAEGGRVKEGCVEAPPTYWKPEIHTLEIHPNPSAQPK